MLISAAGKLSVTKTRDNHPVKRPFFSEPRGFTMVETAIVLLIISIVIARYVGDIFNDGYYHVSALGMETFSLIVVTLTPL